MNKCLKSKIPLILTYLSGAGLIYTAIETAKSTSKAKDIVNDIEKRERKELTTKEKIKKIAPLYVKPVMIGASTCICIAGIHLFDKKQQASISSAYVLLENQYRNYRKRIINEYGKEKDDEIMEDILVNQIPDNTKIYAQGLFQTTTLTLDTYNGPRILFHELNSDVWFESTMEQVLNAEYHLNRNMSIAGYATMNWFYALLGLPDIPEQTYDMGWCIDDEMTWIDFDHKKMKLSDGREYCCIDTIYRATDEWKEYYL